MSESLAILVAIEAMLFPRLTSMMNCRVKTKMSSPQGMSFAEFCYPVMQAWDWWRLYNTRQVQVQIGGADQFGNICTGIDAVKHISATHPDSDVRLEDPGSTLTSPFGFTVPLLTTASGEKFGKSAGNAVWLDRNLTSLFDLYRVGCSLPLLPLMSLTLASAFSEVSSWHG